MKTFFFIICLIVIFSFSNFDIFAKSENRGKKKIILIENYWSSQIILSKILKNILVKNGYNVELKKVSTDDQWGELARGWVHAQVEIWQGTMEKKFNKFVNDGSVVDAGDHDALTREDWWYPAYVEKDCPDLPDWKALNRCYRFFIQHSSDTKGTYWAAPWENYERARIRSLGLKFKVKMTHYEEELRNVIIKAYNHKDNIVLFNWSPNWVDHIYKGKYVDFPDYDPKCETDPDWGISKKWTYDCGNPKKGWLKKAVWKGFRKEWPCAFGIIKNFNFNNKSISKLSYMSVVKRIDTESIANDWIKKNTKKWKEWIPKICK